MKTSLFPWPRRRLGCAWLVWSAAATALTASLLVPSASAQDQTAKPVLHGRHWVAITGKPLGATAGARLFQEGGNAVDAACAMLAVVCTMYDELSWGGETQALIYDPVRKKVRGLNALGVAPTGATPEFFRARKLKYPPSDGPLAAVTPGTPGGLLVMLAEFGTKSLREVLGPAMEMADGYPIEKETADKIERDKTKLRQWPYSKAVFLPHLGQAHEGPHPGEIFRQPELLDTLRKLVQAETEALAAGRNRKEAIQAAYERFYRGDIAQEFVRGSHEQGGLHTLEDLAGWEVHLEDPVMTTYRGIEVYKLTCWVQGPVMLQALNMLEEVDLRAMGLNSARYIHTLYQVMSLAFADRDFYYGDPYVTPVEPLQGLLAKAYARDRVKLIDWTKNNPDLRPGDPYPFEGKENPYRHLLDKWTNVPARRAESTSGKTEAELEAAFHAGTTSIQAADEQGWVVSATPSGGWLPACLAGRTGIAMSQRMQSFVLDEAENPYNVVAPGKRPRATLTPALALTNQQPFLSFAVQGGDSQDQNLLQFFLNVVEFNFNVQEACEGPNFESFQLRSSFGQHEARPGRLVLNNAVPPWVRKELGRMGYDLVFNSRTSGPINAIYFDWEHRTFWGGSSHHGEDYGVAW